MDIFEQVNKIKEELGIDLENKELSNEIDYLKEHTDLFLIDLYKNKEEWEKYEKWKLDKEILKQKVFLVIYKDDKMQIDYKKVKKKENGLGYTDGEYVLNKNHLYLTLEEAIHSLNNYRRAYYFTQNTKKYIEQRKIDFKEMTKEYYGTSKLDEVWYQKIKELNDNNNIEQIYEVYTKSYLGAWYLVRDYDGNRYIVKHKINDVNTKFMMNDFLKVNPYTVVEKDELNIMKYDINPKDKYKEIILDFKMDFKNNIVDKYYKLNKSLNENIELFLKENSEIIKNVVCKYLDNNPEFNKDKDLINAFINHLKFDIKSSIQDDYYKMEFFKENYLINEKNIEQFNNEFNRKMINSNEEIEDMEELG